MLYKISKIEPDSTYNGEIFTYVVTLSNDRNQLDFILSSNELENLNLYENQCPNEIIFSGFGYDISLDTQNKIIYSGIDKGFNSAIFHNVRLTKTKTKIMSDIKDENLSIRNFEVSSSELEDLNLEYKFDIHLFQYSLSLIKLN